MKSKKFVSPTMLELIFSENIFCLVFGLMRYYELQKNKYPVFFVSLNI